MGGNVTLRARLSNWIGRRIAPARRNESDPSPCPLAASGLFDASFYLIEGPDVQEAGLDPITHFRDYGWREGRRPNLYFDPLWYRDLYLADAAPGLDPLTHYVSRGEAAGCKPICFFDPAWYAKTYALPKRMRPLAHYLAYRRSGRFAPNPHFDLAFYLARHGAEIGVNRDPFAHFLRHGAARDLDPSPRFDSAAYRRCEMAPDGIARSPMAEREACVPLVHWLDATGRRA